MPTLVSGVLCVDVVRGILVDVRMRGSESTCTCNLSTAWWEHHEEYHEKDQRWIVRQPRAGTGSSEDASAVTVLWACKRDSLMLLYLTEEPFHVHTHGLPLLSNSLPEKCLLQLCNPSRPSRTKVRQYGRWKRMAFRLRVAWAASVFWFLQSRTPW